MELYFCAYFEIEPIFSRPCWHDIYGGKRHEDRPARFEPRPLAFGLILIHYATAATSQQLKTYAIHFLYRVYLK